MALRKLPRDLTPLVSGNRPRLVVMDYAETDPAVAANLLQAMVRRHEGPTMRVVMLARGSGPWLRYIREHDTAIEDCLDAQDLYPLDPLYATADARAGGLAHARKSFAKLNIATSSTPASTRVHDSASAPSLENRALYVHMQALLEAFGDQDAIAGHLTPQQVLDRVLGHERKFWKRAFDRHGVPDTRRVMEAAEMFAAAVVLCDRIEGRTATAKLLGAASTISLDPSHERGLIDSFGEVYGTNPDSDDVEVLPIEPDLLGETLLARMLERAAKDAEELDRWLDLPFGSDSPPDAIARALTVLTRMADRGVGEAWLGRVLERHGPAIVKRVDETANQGHANPPGSVLEQALGHLRNGEAAAQIGDAVPVRTTELRETEATAYRLAVESARTDQLDIEKLARWLSNLGRAEGAQGRREDALTATQEAVESYRALARDRPDAFLPDLAMALNNLGSDLSDLGRREDALAATQEAVDIRRALARDRPDAFLPDLATSLNNLGSDLSNLGRREDALAATQEAVESYRALARDRPDAFLPDLARSLGVQGSIHLAARAHSDALPAFEEAVTLVLPFVDKLPDAFIPLGAWLIRRLRRTCEEGNLPIPEELAPVLMSDSVP